MTDGTPPTLLERGREQAELDAIIAGAPKGRGRVAVVKGPAGIGKTALLDAASARAAEHGLTVLDARGGELERDFGFGVVRQLLEPAVAAATPAKRRQLMAGAAALAERVFVPDAAAEHDLSDAPDAVTHGLYWLVANLAAESPVLLAIDDAHWADPPSLRFLIYLARRLDGIRAAIAIAVRSGEPGSAQELLRTLEVESGAVVMRPHPLSEAGVEALIESLAGGATRDLCRACHRVTGGNPFMLRALLDEWRREGREIADLDPAAVADFAPDRIAAAVLLRVGRLGQPAMELAEAIAVLGEHASLAHAATITGLVPDEAAAAAEALAAAGLIAEGRPLRFAHPIVRTTIYNDTPAAARSALHARAAAALGQAGEPPESVALHLLAVEPAGDVSVAQRLREAATAAFARGAPETASRYLRRALLEPPADQERWLVAVELGGAAWHAGEEDSVDRARQGFELATDAASRTRAVLSLAPGLMFAGHVDEAVDALERTVSEVEDEALRSGLEAVLLAAGITTVSAHGRVRQRLAQARAREPVLPSPNPAVLACLTTEAAIGGNSASEVASLAERALADGGLLHGPMVETPFPYPAAFWLALTDRPQASREAMGTALAEARARGSLTGTAFPLAYRALAFYRLGELADAEADARAAIEAGPGIPFGSAVAVAVSVLVERGELEAARGLLTETEDAIADPDMLPLQLLREARGVLARAEGDAPAALGELLACRRWEEESGTPTVVPVAWRSQAALAHVALGDAEEARRLAREEVRIARAFGAPRAVGVALRAAGLAEGGDAGVELLGEAVDALGGSQDRLERARALVDLGAALRRAGQRAQARDRLAAGMDLAHRCGASALVGRAREELRVAGARPRRLASTGREALTASELRVAEMAAEGLTNPQIAQALFVTLRTVEMHLSNAYRKLEIGSRRQLPDALAGPTQD